MDLVVDTSVLLSVLTSEQERSKLIALTTDADLIAPGSVHWEIGNALSAMLRRKRLTLEQAQAVLHAYQRIPLRLVEVSIADSIRLASQLGLFAYDAYIIECARTRRTSLISLDKALLAAAKAAGVSVLEVR